MDGKMFALFGLILMVALVGGVSLIQGSPSDEENLDQDAIRIAESNRENILALQEEITGLGAKIDRLRQKPAGLDPRELERLAEQAAARVVAKHLEEESKEQEETVAAATGKETFNLNATMANFLANSNDWEARQAAWAQIKKAGQIDAAIAWLEERAKNSAQDPEAQCDLGEGYIAKLQMGSSDYAILGDLSQKADAAFDATLELDDQHWRGRFQKAVALSFWPPSMGKQGEAIRNFETLIEQQKNQPPNEGHAMTHMFLGNMFSQQGKMGKAKAAWQQGLIVAPNNVQLKKLIANAGGN